MSLLLTRMQNLRSDSRLDKWETRPSSYGALDLFMVQSESPTGLITEELAAKAAASIGRVLEVPVIDYDQGVTIGNARTVTIADDENTSKMLQFTFVTYSWGFTIVPALFMNNEIAMQRDFNAKQLKYIYKFAETLDNAGIAALEAAKTQVIADPLLYAVAGNTVNATFEQRNEILGDLNVLMRSNDYFNQLHVVGNYGIESLVRKLAESGLYNATNKQIQFSDKLWHWSGRIANDTDKIGTGFVVNDDALGVLFRFEREALMGTRGRTGHEWDMDVLPMLNIPVGTYYYEGVGDYNTIAGAASADMTRNLKQHYGFSVDVCFVTAYNSDPAALASPILKFDIGAEVVTP